MEDLTYYAREGLGIHKPWELPVCHEDDIIQKITGAIRLCGNKKFKGENASTTATIIARAMDVARSDYGQKNDLKE